VGLGSFDHERGGRGGADYDSTLGALRDQLAELQLPQIAHGRRAIILCEGPPGAGKKAALKQLAAAFDPCHCAVHSVHHDRREAAEGHWLARFWRQLPVAGGTAIFFRSWYRRVLDDRVQGRIDKKTLGRAFDEINEFEAQQSDYGTLIVKLYFDVSAEVQDARLKARAAVTRNSAENTSPRCASIQAPIKAPSGRSTLPACASASSAGTLTTRRRWTDARPWIVASPIRSPVNEPGPEATPYRSMVESGH